MPKAKRKTGAKANPKTRTKSKPGIDEDKLSKGHVRKLVALRKSLGQEIADPAFAKWLAQRADGPVADPTAERIAAALNPIVDGLRFPRGSSYTVRRGRGRVIVERMEG